MTNLPIFEFGSPLDTICQTGWVKDYNTMSISNRILYIPHEAVNDDSVKQYVQTVTVPAAKSTKEYCLKALEEGLTDFKESVKILSEGKLIL